MDLKSYLEKQGISPPKFAKKVELSRSYIHRLITEKRIPTKYTKKRIEIASDGEIGMDDWPDKKSSPGKE